MNKKGDKVKKRVVSKKKIIKFSLILLSVIAIIIISVLLIPNKKEPKKEIKGPAVVIESIEDYGYSLDDNETEYYNNLFSKLKSILNNEELNEEEYAEIIAQLFLADFFNLDNKVTKNDIGGVQFVYSNYRTDFEKYAKEGIYHYIESDIYGDRTQELPIVTEVDINNIEQKSFEYNEQTDENAYYVEFEISYQKDLGYQSKGSLVLIHSNEKLEIAKMD